MTRMKPNVRGSAAVRDLPQHRDRVTHRDLSRCGDPTLASNKEPSCPAAPLSIYLVCVDLV